MAEIRSSRLYREGYVSFDQYVRERWGMQRSRADELIRTVGCAELLLASSGAPDGDAPLRADTPEATIRQVSRLPTAGLQSAAWRLLSRVSPGGRPTRAIGRADCRMVREAVGLKPHFNGSTPDDGRHGVMFLRPIRRLSQTDFDAGAACLHVDSPEQAVQIISACEVVIDRCRLVQQQLRNKI